MKTKEEEEKRERLNGHRVEGLEEGVARLKNELERRGREEAELRRKMGLEREGFEERVEAERVQRQGAVRQIDRWIIGIKYGREGEMILIWRMRV